MSRSEKEYSFKVTSIAPFINYCVSNKYDFIEKTEQVRTLYKKSDNTMLRLTVKKIGDKVYKEMDFKQDKLSNDSFIERKESKAIPYEDDEAVNSIIEFLDYKKAIELVRNRYVYSKDDIKFEIDEYLSPEEALVVAIEGDYDKITNIFEELKDKYDEYFVKEESKTK